MKTITPTPLKVDDLISSLSKDDNYDYLKIFLTKEKRLTFERDFLLVTRSGFQKVLLKDIDYNELTGSISLVLQNCESREIEKLFLNLQDRDFKCIFVDWTDIKKMVLNESLSNGAGDDELLDFNFEENA